MSTVYTISDSPPATTSSNDDFEIVDLTSSDTAAEVRNKWRERQKAKDRIRAQERAKKAAAAGASTSSSTGTSIPRKSPRSKKRVTSETVEILDSDGVVVIIDTPPKKIRQGTASEPPTAQPPLKPDAAFKCPICLETDRQLKEDGVGFMALGCGHVICKPCSVLLKSGNKSAECPVCRKKSTKKPMSIFL